MTKVPSLSTLRQVFALQFPMQGVIVVGAGRGQGLEDFQSAAAVLCVDARAECIEPLQKQFEASSNTTAVQAVIAARTGPTAFHCASKPDESALIPSESLQPLWRNLTTSRVDEVEARTLPDLLASLEPAPDFRCNWLVIDCLPALSVLEGAGRMVDDLDVIELRCVRDGAALEEAGARLESAEQWLEARGFRPVAQFEETHPQLCKAVFCRDVSRLQLKLGSLEDALARLKRTNEDELRLLTVARDVLTQEKAALTAERDTVSQAKTAADQLAAERQTQLESLTSERQQITAARDALTKDKAALTAERDGLAEEKQMLVAERDTLVQAKAAADQLAAEYQAQVDALISERQQLTAARDALIKEKTGLTAERDTIVQAKAAVDQLAAERQKQLDAIGVERAVLTELDSRFKRQAEELIQLRKFTDSSVKKHVDNAAKQLESTLALQSYFATGDLLDINTEGHSWPISPDFAHYLVELIEFNDYDLIIEFGSGFSTALIAKTLARRAAKRLGKAVGFVSFDHLEVYYRQTLDRLRSAGLSGAVQLMLAPLEDWQGPGGEMQPYYACQQTFSALVQQYPIENLRLLIVVDGPPAGTGPQARYPAGPIVLKHFAGAQIDLLLDDYIRDDEKKVAQRWQDEISAAGLTYSTTLRKFEKEACLIRVQPHSHTESS